jgi:hypothetical protein
MIPNAFFFNFKMYGHMPKEKKKVKREKPAAKNLRSVKTKRLKFFSA